MTRVKSNVLAVPNGIKNQVEQKLLYDIGPEIFTVPMSRTGAGPVTHWGCGLVLNKEEEDILIQALPPGHQRYTTLITMETGEDLKRQNP